MTQPEMSYSAARVCSECGHAYSYPLDPGWGIREGVFVCPSCVAIVYGQVGLSWLLDLDRSDSE